MFFNTNLSNWDSPKISSNVLFPLGCAIASVINNALNFIGWNCLFFNPFIFQSLLMFAKWMDDVSFIWTLFRAQKRKGCPWLPQSIQTPLVNIMLTFRVFNKCHSINWQFNVNMMFTNGNNSTKARSLIRLNRSHP